MRGGTWVIVDGKRVPWDRNDGPLPGPKKRPVEKKTEKPKAPEDK